MKNIYEIFDEFEKASTKEERILVLRKNDNYALKSVLKGTYDPNLEFVIDKVPFYKPSDAPPGLGYTSIHQELGRSYLFVKGDTRVAPTLTQNRKQHILVQILEALEKREAEVFMNMLLKKQKVKNLNNEIVKEAFPDLF
jgi:uncharacterized protein YpiB (UPF0302 family)